MKTRFPLTSEQLELLLAFEQQGSLAKLAEVMGRDQSVISRQLQKLAEDAPVIRKQNGKWGITDLGKKINELTVHTVKEYEKCLQTTIQAFHLERTALIVINAQKGLLKSEAKRSNPHAEKNIGILLNFWRQAGGKVIHVQHVSENPESVFFVNSPGVEFMEGLKPESKELTIQKKSASSFSGTSLQKLLDDSGFSMVVLTGFTAQDCIEATAKDAFENGLSTFVAGDATAMFDFVSHDKKLYQAEKIHELVLANIGLRYATVEETKFFLGA